MVAAKRAYPRFSAFVPSTIWLSPNKGYVRPVGVSVITSDFNELLTLLASGGYDTVLVDQRYRFSEGDSGEAALQIREKFPRISLAVLTPKKAGTKSNRKDPNYIKKIF